MAYPELARQRVRPVGESVLSKDGSWKPALTGLVGASIEWYDFFIYATAAALVFPSVFFAARLPPFVALIASIGLFIASEEIFRIVFGAYGLSYKNPPLQGQVSIGFLNFKQAELLVMLGGGLIIGALALLQSKTRLGIACQATVTDPQMAESFGIDLKKVRYVNFFINGKVAMVLGGSAWSSCSKAVIRPSDN